MTAAILQGVPGSTLDVDFWIDLPPRHCMRAINIGRSIGATMLRNTIIELADGTLVNFIYEVTGLKSFAAEFSKAHRIAFHGIRLPVMPLESIRQSKMAVMRPKDQAQIRLIDEVLRLTNAESPKRK